MWVLRQFSRLSAHATAIACGLAIVGSAASAAETVDDLLAGSQDLLIGDVSEVDLDRVRTLTRQSGPETPDRAGAHEAEQVPAISLEMAVEVALANNLDLDIARADRNVAAREVPATRAKFHPDTGFDFEAAGSNLASDSTSEAALAFVRQEIPTGGSLTVSSDLLHVDVAQSDLLNDAGVTIELRQPLLRGGRTYVARREILDAGYELDIEDARLAAEVLRVSRDAKIAYYETILADRLIEVTEAAVERNKRLIEASKALFEVGRASKRDVVSAQIRLSDDRARLAARRAELSRTLLELRDVLGLPLAQLVRPAESSVPFHPVALRLNEWVAQAVRDRPEVRELRGELEQSALQVRVTGNDVLPQLDVLGLYRRRDTGGDLSEAFNLGNEGWRAGLEFSIPLGNVAARERRAEARIVYGRTERELERQMREIEREVREEVIELRRSLVEVGVQADKVENSREKLEVAVERYRLGIANNLDITDAQEDLLNAETDFLRAIFDYTNGLVRLEASVGSPL